MREMKDSGIKWLGEIPSKWKRGKVKDAFWRKNTKAYDKDPIVLSLARDGVKVRDITNNEGQLAESYFNYNPVEPGDMLINPMDLYSGANCSLSEVSGVISPAYINLKAKEGYYPKYYDYYFKLQYWLMAFFAHGKGVSFENRWTLSITDLLNYPIIIPTETEQFKIANLLDQKCSEIDELISDIEKQICILEDYKRSIITETVTKGLNPKAEMKDSGIEWIGKVSEEIEFIPLKYLLSPEKDSIKVGPFGSELKGNDILETETNYLVYNQRMVLDENLNQGNSFISEEKFKTLKSFQVKPNDILITTRGTIGKIARVPKLGKSGVLHPCLIKFRIDENKYNYQLLRLLFNESNLIEKQLFYQSNVTTIEVIYSKTLKNLLIPFWSLEKQEEIVLFLEKIEKEFKKTISTKRKMIKVLLDYKQSLIFEYVTGKKEVPDE